MAVKYGTYSDFSSLKKGYNPYTGMAKPAAAIPNYGAMRNAALAGFTSPDGMNGLESLKQANTPGSSLPSSTLYEDLFNSRIGPYKSATESAISKNNIISDEARQRATSAYGMLPADYYTNTAEQNLKKYPWLDDVTVKNTLSNTEQGLSTIARLNQQYKDAVQTVQRVLASRGVGGGMYHSGETLYEQGRAAQGNKQNVFDAAQSYQDYFAGVAKANLDFQTQQKKDLVAQENLVKDQLLKSNLNSSTITEQPPTPVKYQAPAATNPYTTDIYKNLRDVLGGKILGR